MEGRKPKSINKSKIEVLKKDYDSKYRTLSLINDLAVQTDCTGFVRLRISQKKIISEWRISTVFQESIELRQWQKIKAMEFIESEIQKSEKLKKASTDKKMKDSYNDYINELQKTFKDLI